jgi:hypothetical protein
VCFELRLLPDPRSVLALPPINVISQSLRRVRTTSPWRHAIVAAGRSIVTSRCRLKAQINSGPITPTSAPKPRNPSGWAA